MSISTDDCKNAIVNFIINNPGRVSSQIVPAECESPAKLKKNWKRISKEKNNGICERGFDYKPYDDQLRAYTLDDGNVIIKVTAQGE